MHFTRLTHFLKLQGKHEKRFAPGASLAKVADRWAWVPHRPGRVQATLASLGRPWPSHGHAQGAGRPAPVAQGREGGRSSWTRISPGRRRWCRLGRRRAAGGGLEAAELRTCGEEMVGGGDSRGSGSIPSTGSKKAATRSFGAPQRKSGRRGTAAGIDGQTRVCRRSAGKRRRGREEDRGEAGRQGILSPWRSFGGGGHHLVGSTASVATRRSLPAQGWRRPWRWARPLLGC
jgi:hypothetical protein